MHNIATASVIFFVLVAMMDVEFELRRVVMISSWEGEGVGEGEGV